MACLKKLTHLDLSVNWITNEDLEMIGELENITDLNLSDNAYISDLSPLASLRNLRHLDISRNFIRDLTPLSKMENLVELNASYNRLTDISPLQNLTKLLKLDVSSFDYNRRVNLSFISPLTNLRLLAIRNLDIYDIQPLKHLKHLEYVDISMNLIIRLTPLSGLINLRVLIASTNLIIDASPLANLTNLRRVDLSNTLINKTMPANQTAYSLDLSNKRIRRLDILFRDHPHILDIINVNVTSIDLNLSMNNIAVWQQFPEFLNEMIRSLDLSYNTIDIVFESVCILKNLKHLNLSHNTIGILNSMACLKKLTYLDLSVNIITNQDLESIGELENITDLNLSDNAYISDLSPLASLTNLRHLDISRNSIHDLTPLSKLYNLVELNASYNRITDFSPHQNLTKLYNITDVHVCTLANLEYLNLSHNNLTGLSSMACLKKLTHLDLSWNRIALINRLYYFDTKEEYQGTTTGVCTLKNLEYLNLSHNRITGLSSMACLKKLTHLDLSVNRINNNKHLESIGELENITDLNLSNNKHISDLSPLASLTNLRHLDISRNSIQDLTPLSKLYILVELNASYNRITDFSPLQNLTKLLKLDEFNNEDIKEVRLDLSKRHLYEFHILYKSLTELTGEAERTEEALRHPLYLNVSGNKIDSLSVFSKFLNIHGLDISHQDLWLSMEWDAGLEMMPNLKVFNASGNHIFNLSAFASAPYRDTRLHHLVLANCEIKDVSPLAKLSQLRHLDLRGNGIREWTPIVNLTSLEYLNLAKNLINKIPQLTKLSNLRILDISYNYLTSLPDYCFQGLVSLEYLYLSGNPLGTVSSLAFIADRSWWLSTSGHDGLTSQEINKHRHSPYRLRHLDLSNCSLRNIGDRAFADLKNLSELDLRFNPLLNISSAIFSSLSRLQHLDLANCSLRNIDDGAFADLKILSELDLRSNPLLMHINSAVFASLDLDTMQTDAFSICCAAEHHVRSCTPLPDEFSSCSDLMARTELKVAIWVLGFMSIFSNVLVIVFRLKKIKANTIQQILIINLSVSDFLMGLYLLTVGAADVFYRDVYYLHEKAWRESPVCKGAGILSLVSSEMSVFTLVFITCDRVLAIVFPFSGLRTTTKRLLVTLSITWLLIVVLAALPLLLGGVFDTFYGRNGVCLPFGITQGDSLLEHDILNLTVLAINLLGFIIILLGYLAIYHTIRKSSHRMRGFQQDTGVIREVKFLKKMSLIVMTDFLCWVPIIILKFLEFRGLKIPPQVSAWTAVFVLPLNSAINPFLYTSEIFGYVAKLFSHTEID